VLPPRLKSRIPDATLFAPQFHVRGQLTAGMAPLRAAIRQRKKVHLAYEDKASSATARTVQPLGLFYWGATWSLGAWCELRQDFRNFRLDRMHEVRVLEETFVSVEGRTLADFFRKYQATG
jgi:predicted DNA-binding transcriptional regulator YafY